jgi:hypothetical protein
MPRQFGGLGILDLHCMNISLLLKWWWKLKDHQYHFIWKQIILVKYSDNMPIKQQSTVWKEINALSQLGQTGSSVVLGNGQDTAFWLDRWAGDCALSSQFHHLFQLCEDSLVSVFTVVMSVG